MNNNEVPGNRQMIAITSEFMADATDQCGLPYGCGLKHQLIETNGDAQIIAIGIHSMWRSDGARMCAVNQAARLPYRKAERAADSTPPLLVS